MKYILSEYLQLWKNYYLSRLSVQPIFTQVHLGEKSSVQAFLCAVCWLVSPSLALVTTGQGALIFKTGLLVCVCKCEMGLEVHWFSVQSLSPKWIEVSAWSSEYPRSRQAQSNPSLCQQESVFFSERGRILLRILQSGAVGLVLCFSASAQPHAQGGFRMM